MSAYRIPFNRPAPLGREQEYIAQSLASGHLSGDGTFTKRCHELLERELHVSRALLTTSCTHALEIAALVLQLGPGDEVVVPSFTFVSTANAFALRGARMAFVDIRPDTLNIDEAQIAGALTPRTRAIVVVHYAGVGCDMDRILAVAGERGVPVIEDNAHGLFGRYRGRPLGSFGLMSTLSFHETKNFTCGEGGALLLNDPDLTARAEIVREKGTDRSRFFRGEVDKYGWVDVGSSYLPSDLLAAMLLGQLEERGRVQARRRFLWERYFEALRPWADRNGWRLPIVPPECEQAYHMFYMLAPSQDVRARLIEHLKCRSILSVFHYLPLHASAAGRRVAARPVECPVTDRVSERLLRLPFFTTMTDEEQALVIERIQSFS